MLPMDDTLYNTTNQNDMPRAINDMKSKLLRELDVWYFYENELKQRIIFDYENAFGDLEEEIEEKNRAADHLEKRIELLKLKKSRGERFTSTSLKLVNALAERQYERRARQSDMHTQPHTFNVPPINKNFAENIVFQEDDKEDLTKIYRNLVKILHPDAKGDTEDFRRFWDKLQFAWRERNGDVLQMLNLSLQEAPKAAANPSQTVKKDTFARLQQSLEKQETTLKALKESEPFIYEAKLKNKLWVRRRREFLKNKLFLLDKRINHSKRVINILSGAKVEG